jgi:hypothetical protein
MRDPGWDDRHPKAPAPTRPPADPERARPGPAGYEGLVIRAPGHLLWVGIDRNMVGRIPVPPA